MAPPSILWLVTSHVVTMSCICLIYTYIHRGVEAIWKLKTKRNDTKVGLVQACVNWPIRGDLVFWSGPLKRQELKQSVSDRGGLQSCSTGKYEQTWWVFFFFFFCIKASKCECVFGEIYCDTRDKIQWKHLRRKSHKKDDCAAELTTWAIRRLAHDHTLQIQIKRHINIWIACHLEVLSFKVNPHLRWDSVSALSRSPP